MKDADWESDSNEGGVERVYVRWWRGDGAFLLGVNGIRDARPRAGEDAVNPAEWGSPVQ
jgi:hypothetical protein